MVTVPNQETYFVEGCAEIQSMTFDYSDVRFSMDECSTNQYFKTSRVNNITTLPFNWTQKRVDGGTEIYLYFLPDKEYPLNIYGKFYLYNVGLFDDLRGQADSGFLEYLRYRLAQYICSDYGIVFNPESEKLIESYKRKLMYMSPPDVTLNKVCVLSSNNPGLNWWYINVGKGRRPY